jgi:hypothetical protein
MAFFYNATRKVEGTGEVSPLAKIYSTKEYALFKGYSVNHVAKLCRRKRIRSYKSGGHWWIVGPRN